MVKKTYAHLTPRYLCWSTLRLVYRKKSYHLKRPTKGAPQCFTGLMHTPCRLRPCGGPGPLPHVIPSLSPHISCPSKHTATKIIYFRKRQIQNETNPLMKTYLMVLKEQKNRPGGFKEELSKVFYWKYKKWFQSATHRYAPDLHPVRVANHQAERGFAAAAMHLHELWRASRVWTQGNRAGVRHLTGCCFGQSNYQHNYIQFEHYISLTLTLCISLVRNKSVARP